MALPTMYLYEAAKRDQTRPIVSVFQVGFPVQTPSQDGGETVQCLGINFLPWEKELGDVSVGVYLGQRK